MRICLVCRALPDPGAVGAGAYAVEAGRALSAAGHQVWLLAGAAEDGEKSPLPALPGFHRVLRARPGRGDRKAPEFLQGRPYYALSDSIHRTLSGMDVSFDYIEFEDIGALGVVPLREQRLLGTYGETVLGVRVSGPTWERLLFGGRRHRMTLDERHLSSLEDYVLKHAGLRLFPSAGLQERLAERLGLPDSPGPVLLRPAAFPGDPPPPPAPGRSLEELAFLYFGPLEPGAGLDALVEAFSRLPGLRLQIAGEEAGSDPFGRSYLDHLRRKAGGQVTFLETSSKEDILARAARADVCLFPSLWEGAGETWLEAMSLARIVVAGRRSGAGEVILSGETGFLVDGGDPDSLVRCLQEEVGGNLHRLDEIGRNAARRIREAAAPEAFARKLEEAVLRAKEEAVRRPERPPARGKVTVVIPFHSGKDTLGDAVDSALAQTYPDLEVLVVDDGSPFPEAEKLLAETAARDGRIRVVRQESRGLSAARNRGIREARGEFLVFLDDDDRLHPRYLEWAVAAMARNQELGFLTSYTRFVDTTGRNPDYCFNPMPFQWSAALILNQFGTAGGFFRREVFLEKGLGYDEVLIAYEDWALWMDLARSGVEGDVLPRICYDYRIRKGSMMHTQGWARHLALVGLLIERHFPHSGDRERETLTVLNQTWGAVALAVRLSGASLGLGASGGEGPPSELAPVPLVHVPLRHKVVDLLSEKVRRIPWLSRALRRVLVLVSGILEKER